MATDDRVPSVNSAEAKKPCVGSRVQEPTLRFFLRSKVAAGRLSL